MKTLSEYLQSQAAAIGGAAADQARQLELAAADATDQITNLQAAVSNEREIRGYLERELSSARKARIRLEAALVALQDQIVSSLANAMSVVADVRDREEIFDKK